MPEGALPGKERSYHHTATPEAARNASGYMDGNSGNGGATAG